MFGHQDDPVYGHSWKWDKGRSDVLEVTGEYPAVMGWDLGGMEIGDTLNLDGVAFSRMREEAIRHASRGGVNAFSWHPRKPFGEGTSWDVPDSITVRRILTDSIAGEWFDTSVERIADFFNSLKDKQGNAQAVIFRAWHEHTGNWFWWGSESCTPDEYKALWERTRRIMDAKGATQILWAYSPDRVKDADQYTERYPGDRYVDILGADVYHYDGDAGISTYVADASRTLGIANEFAQRHGKILAFTETGCESLSAKDWYTGVLLPLLRKYPVAYVTVWRNAHDLEHHFYTPFKGHPSAEDFKKFHDDPHTVFVAE